LRGRPFFSFSFIFGEISSNVGICFSNWQNFRSFFELSPNLTKSSYGRSPLEQHHTKFTGAITCKSWVLLETVKSMILQNILILQKVAIIFAWDAKLCP
jgi:hypothetical protein